MSTERKWNPGDSHVLPDVDPRGYGLGSQPLPPSMPLCGLCGNVLDSDPELCDDCIEGLTDAGSPQ